jgi:hypothetical protein
LTKSNYFGIEIGGYQGYENKSVDSRLDESSIIQDFMEGDVHQSQVLYKDYLINAVKKFQIHTKIFLALMLIQSYFDYQMVHFYINSFGEHQTKIGNFVKKNFHVENLEFLGSVFKFYRACIS